MEDIKKYGDFENINEEHHLEGDIDGMRGYVMENLEAKPLDEFLQSLEEKDLTSLYHLVETWTHNIDNREWSDYQAEG